MGPRQLRYASVVLDVDSTLTRIEGIEWLAARRGADVARAVAAMTDRAMRGTVPLDAVYGERLALVRPTRADVAALAQVYIDATVPDARHALDTLRSAGVQLAVVSGGVREAVVPFAASLGVGAAEVYAVAVRFAPDGSYVGFDTTSVLARRGGKPALVRTLGLPRPLLALGDGSTDAELKTDLTSGSAAVDTFAAFVGVAARTPVVAVADVVVRSFLELPTLVLGPEVEIP